MKKKTFPPLIIIGILFFIFGFVTWLNSTLVPFLKTACQLSNFKSYFVTFMFYIAYFVLAIPSGMVINRIGYRRSMSAGLAVMAAGAALFIPAAFTRWFLFFLTGLFLMGAGLALLQTAANPYAAVLGSPETAARRISIMGVCNKFAGVLAPLVLGSIILKDISGVELAVACTPPDEPIYEELLNNLARRCLVPYYCIVGCLAALACFVHFSSLPEINTAAQNDTDTSNCDLSPANPLRKPRFWLGVVALFFYVGVEVIGVDSLIGFALSEGISPATAKVFPAFSMVAFIIGYLIGIICMPRIFSQRTALFLSAEAGILVTLAAVAAPGMLSLYILVWLGLANAMIWPAVWGLSIEGLGRHTSLGSSLLIMAIVGGALLPLLFGKMIDITGYRTAYLTALPCYAVILLYGLVLKGQRKSPKM